MGVIRDVMPVFELYQPASVDDAIRLLDRHGADAWVLAGGLDSMDWLKDRLKKPKGVVDLSQIKELHGIKEADGGLEIGAMTSLIDITRMNVLAQNELLVAIRIPATMAGAQFYFEKVRDRQVWDFPLVNVAAAIKPNGATIGESRIVVNAVAATPKRLKNVEAFISGKPRNEDTAKAAGEMAVQGAQTLRHNGYKVPLMRNLVRRAIRGQDAAAPRTT